jgi:lipoprotein-anchoring transpeptidase ErfK/SrfK
VPEAGLSRARTEWAVTVQLGSGTMTVTKAGRSHGSWPIAQGKPSTPTPVGQTFLVSGFVDPTQNFSPVIYALGAHSDTLDSYGGGPGTVAVHGWPTAAGREGHVSHGCVRVPDAALKLFGKLPTGTPVDIVK